MIHFRQPATTAMAAISFVCCIAQPCMAQQGGMIRDKQVISVGSVQLVAQPWCPRFVDPTLKEGRDYRNTVTYETPGVTQNVQLTWRWPKTAPTKCGVQGYNHIAWGNYDNGSTATPVTPRQVKAIGDLTFSFGIDYAADPSEFNGLMEFYLTGAPNRADLKKVEIGFFWQAPGVTQKWAASTRQLGVFTDRYGKRWTVSVEENTSKGSFVTFVPFGGYQGYGSVDAKGAIDWLRARGRVSGDWWFNGAALGVEPIKGFGIAIVRWFGATYR